MPTPTEISKKSKAGMRKFKCESQQHVVNSQALCLLVSPEDLITKKTTTELDLSNILIKYGNNSLNYSAIQYAAYLGEIDIVDFLLNNGFEIEELIDQLFYIAFDTKNFKLAEFLKFRIGQFENFSIKGHRLDKSSVEHCASTDNYEGLKWLFENGAKMSDISGPLLWNALEKNHSTATIELLIQNGADCKYRKYFSNYYYSGLLTPAVQRREIKIIQILIKNGAPINENLRKGSSNNPLNSAIDHNQTEIVKILVEAGAQLHSNKFKAGKQTRSFFLQHTLGYKNFDIMFLLLDAGLEIDTKVTLSYGSFNPLSFAIFYNNISAVEELLKRGASTVGVMKTAIKAGSKEIIDLLLKYGAKIDDPLAEPPQIEIPIDPLEEALETYFIDELDTAKGFKNPLDMAKWKNDFHSCEILKKKCTIRRL